MKVLARRVGVLGLVTLYEESGTNFIHLQNRTCDVTYEVRPDRVVLWKQELGKKDKHKETHPVSREPDGEAKIVASRHAGEKKEKQMMTLTEAFLKVFETLNEVKEKTSVALTLSGDGIASLAQTLYNNDQKDGRVEQMNNRGRLPPPSPRAGPPGAPTASHSQPAPAHTGNGVATTKQLAFIWKLIKERGANAGDISARYGGAKINALSFTQAKAAIDVLLAMPKPAYQGDAQGE